MTNERSAVSMLGLLVAIAALVVAGIAVTVSNDHTSQAATAGAATSVEVALSEFAISPATLSAPTGHVTVAVHNAGAQAHDLSAPSLGRKTASIAPGGDAVLDLGDLAAGTYALLCTIPGHSAAGMTGSLLVGTGGAAATAAAPAAAEQTSTGAASATIDPNATPPADWHPYDPALQPAPGATEHKLTLHAIETTLSVAPGVTQQMWTFGGQVPGPVLRGHIGDVFTVTLVNDGKVGHSIDFHASKVAWNDKMRTIKPGESLVYQFKANYAGIFMYHCGTAPALHHIGNGMYGALIVDPPVLAPVDHEYLIVQSELYLGPQGQPGDLTKMQHEAWDAVVFNGYASQYKFSPIRVEPDERIRVWVLDAGPSENSAFHVVGTVFDTVYKEGTYLLQPDDRRGGSQVLDLQPAQGGFVEMSFAEKGLYPIVTHKFANPGKGALGLFQAGDVTMAAGAGH